MKTATETGNMYATYFVEQQILKDNLSMREAKMKTEAMIKQGKTFNNSDI